MGGNHTGAGIGTGAIRRLGAALAAAIAACWLAAGAAAAPIVTPAGFNPGDQYRLAFVTSTGFGAGSANIADYNAFVSGKAAAVAELNALAVSWFAIASTAAVNARTNTGTGTFPGVPIFLLDGSKLADDSADLWDGTIDVLFNVDETGAQSAASFVWSGTQANGFAVAAGQLGTGIVARGSPTSTVSTWIENPVIRDNGQVLPFYAISGVITVAEPPVTTLPEPGMLLLFGAGLAGIGLAARRRRG